MGRPDPPEDDIASNPLIPARVRLQLADGHSRHLHEAALGRGFAIGQQSDGTWRLFAETSQMDGRLTPPYFETVLPDDVDPGIAELIYHEADGCVLMAVMTDDELSTFLGVPLRDAESG